MRRSKPLKRGGRPLSRRNGDDRLPVSVRPKRSGTYGKRWAKLVALESLLGMKGSTHSFTLDAAAAFLAGLDDPPDCPACEGVGSHLADCTTRGQDCACNGPRVTCARCDGEGFLADLPTGKAEG